MQAGVLCTSSLTIWCNGNWFKLISDVLGFCSAQV